MMRTKTTRQCDYSLTQWTSLGWQQNKGSLGTKTAWPNTTTLGSITETSKLETLFLERSWAPLGTLPKGNSAPIGKDLTELHRGRERALTTWRCQKDRNCHTRGTPSTYESITSRSGNTKTNLFYLQQILVLLLSFIIYFSYFIIYFSFLQRYLFLVLSPKGRIWFQKYFYLQMHGNKRSLFEIAEVSILEIYGLKSTEVDN